MSKECSTYVNHGLSGFLLRTTLVSVTIQHVVSQEMDFGKIG